VKLKIIFERILVGDGGFQKNKKEILNKTQG
jgi:hypothetical protein